MQDVEETAYRYGKIKGTQHPLGVRERHNVHCDKPLVVDAHVQVGCSHRRNLRGIRGFRRCWVYWGALLVVTLIHTRSVQAAQASHLGDEPQRLVRQGGRPRTPLRPVAERRLSRQLFASIAQRRRRPRGCPKGWRQRVVVKASYKMHSKSTRGLLRKHLTYLERQAMKGGAADAILGQLLDRDGRPVDRLEIAREYSQADRHWRFVIAPENGAQLDMHEFARVLMARIEAEVGTLDYVFAIHGNAEVEHPHAHVVIKGVDFKGDPLTFSRDFVSQRVRSMAEELATESLGRRTPSQVESALYGDITAMQDTQLDAVIRKIGTANKNALTIAAKDIKLRRGPLTNKHVTARLQFLTQLGLARRVTVTGRFGTWPKGWLVRSDFQSVLARVASRQGEHQQRAALDGDVSLRTIAEQITTPKGLARGGLTGLSR